MAPNLIDRIRSSSPTTQPSAADVEWFLKQPLQSSPAAAPASVGGRRRRASLALVLREVDGRVEMLVIKRTVSPRYAVLPFSEANKKMQHLNTNKAKPPDP